MTAAQAVRIPTFEQLWAGSSSIFLPSQMLVGITSLLLPSRCDPITIFAMRETALDLPPLSARATNTQAPSLINPHNTCFVDFGSNRRSITSGSVSARSQFAEGIQLHSPRLVLALSGTLQCRLQCVTCPQSRHRMIFLQGPQRSTQQ